MVKELKDFGSFGSQDPFLLADSLFFNDKEEKEMLVQFIIAGSLLGFWVYDSTRKRKEDKEN